MTRSALPTVGVIQGETWDKIYITASANPTYPTGDFTSWTATGQVRDKRADKGGVLLAEFTFTSLYDSEELKTYFYPVLSADDTGYNLPMTKYQGVGTPSDSNCFVYDIEVTNGSEVVKLAPGYLYVIGEANRDE